MPGIRKNKKLQNPSPYLVEVIKSSQILSEQTNGKFDITVQPLWNHYYNHFILNGNSSFPDDKILKNIINSIHWKNVVIENNTIILINRNELLSFLENASNQLDKGNYGYSKTNFFEEFREDNNLIILEMNYTRYKKDGSVMGNKEMTATYVLRKSDENYKVISLIPHSSLINNK